MPAIRRLIGGDYGGLVMGDDPSPLLAKGGLKPGKTYLANLDSSDGAGTHWGLLRSSIESPGTVFWWDAYGLMPPAPLTRAIKAAGYHVLVSDAEYQHMSTPQDMLCGPRVVYAIQYISEQPEKDLTRFRKLASDA